VIHKACAGPQHIGIARHGFVDLEDKRTALSVAYLLSAAGDVVQTGGEIRQMRPDQHNVPATVLISVRNLEAFDGMVP